MDVDQIKELTQSLAEYAPKVNEMSTLINSSSMKAAQLIIAVMFLIELDSWYRYLKREGGGLNSGLFAELAVKFLFAFILVTYSATIFDGIVELFGYILRGLSKIISIVAFKGSVKTDGVDGWVLKNFLGLISWLSEAVSSISIKMIIFMRAFEMYILKAIAPLIIAFWMADSTRDMAKNLLKQFAAAAFQGIVLFIVVAIFAAFVTDDLFKVSTGKAGADIAFAGIFKLLVFIFTIWKTQQQSKKLFGTS